MLAGVVMIGIGEEIDRIASRRIDENAALRELCAAAAPLVSDAGLRARLEGAASTLPSGHRISQLDADNAALRGLLILLHAHVEDLPGAAARALEARIWRELRASTERRKLSLGAF